MCACASDLIPYHRAFAAPIFPEPGAACILAPWAAAIRRTRRAAGNRFRGARRHIHYGARTKPPTCRGSSRMRRRPLILVIATNAGCIILWNSVVTHARLIPSACVYCGGGGLRAGRLLFCSHRRLIDAAGGAVVCVAEANRLTC